VTDVAGSPYAHVTRLTSNGALDTTWGAAATGTVQIAAATVADQQSNHSTLGFNANLGGLLVDPAGSVTGAATTLGSQALVFRLTSTGRLDKTLASTGSLVIDVTAGDDRATDLERTADGRVLLGGYRTDLNTNWLHMIAPGPVIPDYSAATNNWAGTGAGLFGACLLGGANIATDVATWTPDSNLGADCADGDGDPWRPIVDTNDATALVARSSGAGETAARIDVMFGVRIDGGQKPGHYQAPITFEVLAPSA
jgi:hypothetical protein